MRCILLIEAASFLVLCAVAKSASDTPPETPIILQTTSTMVTVPTLVRSPSGRFITNLTAGDFELYDNGIRQSVKLQSGDREPIALLVLLQTGGPAQRHFSDFGDLAPLLDWLLGTDREIMLVTFDSRVETVWHFPVRSDGVAHSLTHAHAGDRGAAITDAVQFGVDQLQNEPGNFRRIVLLVSQEQDQGSATMPEQLLRTLGKAGTALYSLTFPTLDRRSKPARSRVPKSPPLTPLANALDKLHQNTAAEIAAYTGGANAAFSSRRDFDEAFKAFAADIQNRCMLSFQPSPHKPGFHQLTVKVNNGLTVTARGGYWFDSAYPEP